MYRIMLVEDDPTMVDLLTTLFKLEGYQIHFFDPEISFVESVRRHEPDVIFMDIHLRLGGGIEVSGFDLLQEIRSDPNLHNRKMILTSGMDLRIQSKEAGADAFIMKPFMPDELIGTIKKLME